MNLIYLGKGKCTVASRDIEAMELILFDSALVVGPRNITEPVSFYHLVGPAQFVLIRYSIIDLSVRLTFFNNGKLATLICPYISQLDINKSVSSIFNC